MAGRVAVGVLGCANVADRKLIPALHRYDRTDVVAVASRNPAKARSFATRFGCAPVSGYAALLERPDVDAVYIPLPPALHAPWAELALQAGKHVLVEKPAVSNSADASALVELARSRGLVLMENFMFLHHRRHWVVKNLIGDGAVGEPQVLSAAFGFPPLPADNFRYDRSLGGGALLDAGCYTLRAATALLGTDLHLDGTFLRHDPDKDVDLAGGALLHSPGGAMAELTWGMNRRYVCEYSIWGTTGRLFVDRAFTAPADFTPVIRLAQGDGEREIVLPPDDQATNLVGEFAAAVRHEQDPEQHYADILRQTALLEQVSRRAGGTDSPARAPITQ